MLKKKWIIKSDDTVIEKHKFYQHKNPVSIDNIDINEVAVSYKISFGEKDFECFIDDNT